MTWLSTLADVANTWGAIPFLANCSATELAFLFLSSKPLFVAAALWVGFWSRRTRLPDASESDRFPASSS